MNNHAFDLQRGSEMAFADITVVPVATAHKDAYVAFSRRMAEVYRDHGATRVLDCWQDSQESRQADFHADGVEYGAGLPDLASAAGAAHGESVVVTITEWPSRAARDRGVAAATRDPRVLATLDEEPGFDGGRLLADIFEITMDLPSDEVSACPPARGSVVGPKDQP